MNVYKYLEELANKYNVDYSNQDELVKKIVYSNSFAEIKEVDDYRNNGNYYWVYQINNKFYQLTGTYTSHYGTDIWDYDLVEVEKKQVIREKWIAV